MYERRYDPGRSSMDTLANKRYVPMPHSLDFLLYKILREHESYSSPAGENLLLAWVGFAEVHRPTCLIFPPRQDVIQIRSVDSTKNI